jgi:hypothetical protein
MLLCPCRARLPTEEALDNHLRKSHHAPLEALEETFIAVETPSATMVPPPKPRRPSQAFPDQMGLDPSVDNVVPLPPYHTMTLERWALKLHRTGALLCKKCRHGISMSQVGNHIALHVPVITSADRLGLRKVLDDLQASGLFLPGDEFRPPTLTAHKNLCAFDPDLLDPIDGFRCEFLGCNRAFLAGKNKFYHMHGETKARSVPCKMQSIFPAGAAHYFPVHMLSRSDASPTTPTPSSPDEETGFALADSLSALQQEDAIAQSSYRERNSLVEVANWASSLGEIVRSRQLVESVLQLRAPPHAGNKNTRHGRIRAMCETYLIQMANRVNDGKDVEFPHSILVEFEYGAFLCC